MVFSAALNLDDVVFAEASAWQGLAAAVGVCLAFSCATKALKEHRGERERERDFRNALKGLLISMPVHRLNLYRYGNSDGMVKHAGE